MKKISVIGIAFLLILSLGVYALAHGPRHGYSNYGGEGRGWYGHMMEHRMGHGMMGGQVDTADWGHHRGPGMMGPGAYGPAEGFGPENCPYPSAVSATGEITEENAPTTTP